MTASLSPWPDYAQLLMTRGAERVCRLTSGTEKINSPRDPTTTADPHRVRRMFMKRCRSIHSLTCTRYRTVHHSSFSCIFGATAPQSEQETRRHTKTRELLYHSLVSGNMKEAAGISRFVSLRPESQRSLANRHLVVWFKFYFLP